MSIYPVSSFMYKIISSNVVISNNYLTFRLPTELFTCPLNFLPAYLIRP
jgi:hypothetical protein